MDNKKDTKSADSKTPSSPNAESTSQQASSEAAPGPSADTKDESILAANTSKSADSKTPSSPNAESTSQQASSEAAPGPSADTKDESILAANTSKSADSKTPSSPNAESTSQQASSEAAPGPSADTKDESILAANTSSASVRFHESTKSGSSIISVELGADIFETILFHLGEFGRYQKMLVVFMIPFAIYFTWVYFAPMFLVLTPQPFWCYVPELATLSKEKRRDLTAPGALDGDWDGCFVYQTDWSTVLSSEKPPAPETPVVPCTTGWEFSYDDINFDTVVSERAWVCKDDMYIPAANSAFFAGCIVGGFIFGGMADRFGRVPALMAVNILGGIAGMATIFTSGVWDFIFCRFVHGMAYDNCVMIAYILVLEYVGPQYRTFVANFPIVVYYGAGSVALPWIACLVADWQWFTFITSLPMFAVISAPWLMPESARWLISRGRVEQALHVLRKFERINKVQIPAAVVTTFVATAEKEKRKKKESFMTLFESHLLRQTAVFLSVTYSLLVLVYDALVRLCESLSGPEMRFFVTFTINAAAEIPSVIMVALLLDKLGRRNLTCGPAGIAAILILIAMFVPEGPPRIVFAVAARFLMNLAMTVAVQWTTEILPTPFRATGSATMHITGFAASLLSPIVVYSEHFWSVLPFPILSVLAVIASVFSLLVPETKGQEMPQTIADAEKIITEHSLYGQVRGRSISRAFMSVTSTTFIEPIKRPATGRVSRQLSRSSVTKL